MVDNRYTGVGYEPPFETPSDKDFMSAHIESLEAEIAALRERQRVLVEALKDLLNSIEILNSIRPDAKAKMEQWVIVFASEDKARAALSAKEG